MTCGYGAWPATHKANVPDAIHHTSNSIVAMLHVRPTAYDGDRSYSTHKVRIYDQ